MCQPAGHEPIFASHCVFSLVFFLIFNSKVIALLRSSNISLLAEALFLVFADGRKETSAMGRKRLY